jgi:EmrB/QacA subfamily drug resistance transporter
MTTPDAPAADAVAGDPHPHAWWALGVTTLVFFLTVIDVTAVNVAFPSIRGDFDVAESMLGWIISGYNITVAALLLVAGRYADSFGRKRLFLPGVAIFAIGSLFSGFAPSAGALIAARVVQGVGGAIIAPTALAVVLPEFPPSKRSTVIGITGATGALGAVAGPALGAALTEAFSWRAIFFINVPLSLIVLAVAPRLLRESKNPAATGRIDLLGVPIGTIGIGLVMFGIAQSESWGLGDPRVLALLLGGVALLPVLIRRSRSVPEPLIDLELFRLRSFSSTNAAVALYSMAFTSGFLANSLLLQEMWDLSLTETGLALVPSPLLSAAVSPLAGRLADRIGHRWILAVGTSLCGLGYLSYLLTLGESATTWTRFVPTSIVVGIGVGATIATWASAGLADVPTAKFGTANATIRTTQQVSYALGISVIVAVLADVSENPTTSSFRWAWAFVGAFYMVSAVTIALTFPAGSSTDRAAGGTV